MWAITVKPYWTYKYTWGSVHRSSASHSLLRWTTPFIINFCRRDTFPISVSIVFLSFWLTWWCGGLCRIQNQLLWSYGLAPRSLSSSVLIMVWIAEVQKQLFYKIELFNCIFAWLILVISRLKSSPRYHVDFFFHFFFLLYSNSDWNGAKGKKFSQSVMERHFLKEVLYVRGWVWGAPLCVAAESHCSNHVPALMESDGSKSGRTEGSIGSVWTQPGWQMLNPKSIFLYCHGEMQIKGDYSFPLAGKRWGFRKVARVKGLICCGGELEETANQFTEARSLWEGLRGFLAGED